MPLPLLAAPADTVMVGKPGSWVMPPPAVPPAPPEEATAMRFAYLDNQILAGPAGLETYSAWRIKVLRPEGLAVGNIVLSWRPDSGAVHLHGLRLIRSGSVTDLTQSARFTVLRREDNLEQATLDGKLTAVFQVPGLQVGDELEFAATIGVKDPTLPDVRAALALLPQAGMPGAFRLRVAWPTGTPMRWQSTPDLALAAPVSANGVDALTVEMRDPAAPPPPVTGAPLRYSLRRMVEFTNLKDWADLSRRLAPLYAKAAQLRPDSPLRAEAARIAAATPDPERRASMALRLVEDKVRYVYVGLDGANMTPANADETWQRRFGDCKGKTVLLIALLRELGIAGTPLLVNTKGGDPLADRLPDPALFDHVVVRAMIAGKPRLLDGTRLGDGELATLAPNEWRNGLPLTEAGDGLLTLPQPPAPWPLRLTVLDVDLTAGFGDRAPVKATRVVRGNEAMAIGGALRSMPLDQAEQALKRYWNEAEGWFEPTRVTWHADEASGAVVLTAAGEGDVEWEGGGKNDDQPANQQPANRQLAIWGAGFVPPAKFRRPREQDQTLPWQTDFPAYSCWITTLRLPPQTPTWHWEFNAEPVDRTLGGVAYWRRAALQGNVMRTVMSRRTLVPEISAQDAEAVNKALPDFDNAISHVRQAPTFKGAASWPARPLPFTDATDWTSPQAPCAAPVASASPAP